MRQQIQETYVALVKQGESLFVVAKDTNNGFVTPTIDKDKLDLSVVVDLRSAEHTLGCKAAKQYLKDEQSHVSIETDKASQMKRMADTNEQYVIEMYRRNKGERLLKMADLYMKMGKHDKVAEIMLQVEELNNEEPPKLSSATSVATVPGEVQPNDGKDSPSGLESSDVHEFIDNGKHPLETEED
mmetsp:Transcript_23563/g.41814  ORF Transcript_23563/g.41814 Transcript_23563/m.41814 type:complete len:185 (-) Transcript_23563:25-579(-)